MAEQETEEQETEERIATRNVGGTQFAIQKIYLKDCSFEVPGAPEVFKAEWKPRIEVAVATESRALEEEHLYDVVLLTTLTCHFGEDVAYLAEVHQGGVFTIGEMEDAELEKMLGIYCPNILFPFAREAIAGLVTRGGFPQMIVSPVNFEKIFERQKAQAQAEAEAAGQGG